jgi:UDP-glucuronate 4-epimerase
VLVTGGVGFIGGHVCAALLDRGDAVVALDSFDPSSDTTSREATAALLERHPAFRLVRGDIRDRSALDSALCDGADVVLHLAAKAGVRQSLADPAGYADVNVTGTAQVLEAARAAGVGRVVFASSSSVYGARDRGPFTEDMASAAPTSPYAASKRAGELLCGTFHAAWGLQTTALRFFTVYGPGQRPDMAIAAFLRKALAGEPLPVFGDGSSLRDYTFVSDIVEGVLAALDTPLGFAVLNLGGGRPIRLDALVALIGEVTGRSLRVERLGTQRGDVPLTFADLRAAKAALGYAPRVGLVDGLCQTRDWMINTPGSNA